MHGGVSKTPVSSQQGAGAGRGPGKQSGHSIRGYPQFQWPHQELGGAGSRTGRTWAQREFPASLPVLATGQRPGTLAGSTWVRLEEEGMKVSAEKKSRVNGEAATGESSC